MMKAIILFLMFLLSTSSWASYNSIHLVITQDDMSKYRQKAESYDFSNSQIVIQGERLSVKKLATRGQTSIRAPRRSFSVKLEEKITLNNLVNGKVEQFKTKDFKLVNMWEDNGYVTAQLGYNFFREFDLYKTRTTYAEVFINDVSQGLYLVVDNPEVYAQKEAKAECFIRRGYKKNFEIKFPKIEDDKEKYTDCEEAFKWSMIPSKHLKGEALYNYLSKVMNLKAYYKWLMINTLLESGDYSDEVYFYAVKDFYSPTYLYFEIMAWDPDDIFQKPHLSIQNILRSKRLKQTLLMSLEIHLERLIDRDAFLYAKFAEDLIKFLETEVTDEFIDKLIADTRNKIGPYLGNDRIKEMSKLDRLDESIMETGYTTEYVDNLLSQYATRIKTRKQTLLIKAQNILK